MEDRTYKELKQRASKLQSEIDVINMEIKVLHVLSDILRSGDDYEIDMAFISDPEPLKLLIKRKHIRCTRVQGGHEWYELTELGKIRLDEALQRQ